MLTYLFPKQGCALLTFNVNVGDLGFSMADSEDDSMGSSEHFEKEVSTIRYTTDRTNTGIQLEKDISNKPELILVSQDSESQLPSPTIQNPTLEDLGIERCFVESGPESNLSIRRRGRYDCNICSSFHLQEKYNITTCHFIDEMSNY